MMVQSMIMMVLRQPNAINPKMASVAREDNLKSYDQELSLRAPIPIFLAQLDQRQTPFYVIQECWLDLSQVLLSVSWDSQHSPRTITNEFVSLVLNCLCLHMGC